MKFLRSIIFAAVLISPICLGKPAIKHYIQLGQQRGFFEGDIKLDTRNRNGILPAQRWDNATIPYTINNQGYTQETIDMILKGIKLIERHTCIRFIPRSNQADYLEIINGGYCYSTGVGKQGGKQQVSLRDSDGYSCFERGTVVHELLHAIGLWHEQARYDRDNYITIHWERLQKDDTYSRYQLRKVKKDESSTYGVPYNYASVMHYDAWALGDYSPGFFIMQPKDMSMLGIMGFAKTANESDFEKVRRIYGCKGRYPTVPPDSGPCEDERPDLCGPENTDYCDKDIQTVKLCKRTCGYCDWGKPITATPRPFCEDYRDDCPTFKDQCNTAVWMKRTCPFTCGFCDRGNTRYPITTTTASTTSTKAVTTAGPCVDSYQWCSYFLNECGKSDWTYTGCRKSCNYCR